MTQIHTFLKTACLTALLCFAAVGSVVAQSAQNIGLIADTVSFDPDTGILVASGNVRIVNDGNIITASQVIYDQRNNRLTIPGPTEITQADGTIIRAEQADLSTDLQNGLIRGATLIIENQFQMTSEETQRSDGRFTILQNSVASSCHVCNANDTPFWQIRSRRTIHDSETKRIYFERATLDFLGVPIIYIPKLRIPDPSVERATGFLFPIFVQSSALGYGVKLPYYIVLGDHADATLTPFLSTKGGLTLEGEYRQNFARGTLTANGAVAFDNGTSTKDIRAYLRADGEYQLGNGYRLDIGLDFASDEAFLAQYNYGTQDRLTSFATISKTRANSYFSVGTSRTQSLRTNEVDTEIPIVFPEVYVRRSYQDALLGGRLGITGQSSTLLRENSSVFARVGAGLDYQKDWQLKNGMQARVIGEANANYYSTKNHADYGTITSTSTNALIAAELRWPWAKSVGQTTHVVEPIIQAAWAGADRDDDINEDSTQVEFEDTNLFSLNRFPGYDRSETGKWVNLGVRYTRYDPSGWNYGISIGRVFRQSGSENQFTDVNTAGLENINSDYVSLLQFSLPNKFDFVNRTLFSDQFSISKNETRVRYTNEQWQASLNYTWLEEESVLAVSDVQHELGLKIDYNPDKFWSYGVEWRENLQLGEPVEGSLKAKYANECVAINFSVSRQYTASGIVEPDTEYELSVELVGLGSKSNNQRKKHRCNG
jgi:LPS-assembly protein